MRKFFYEPDRSNAIKYRCVAHFYCNNSIQQVMRKVSK
jgi:hypothetical protein